MNIHNNVDSYLDLADILRRMPQADLNTLAFLLGIQESDPAIIIKDIWRKLQEAEQAINDMAEARAAFEKLTNCMNQK